MSLKGVLVAAALMLVATLPAAAFEKYDKARFEAALAAGEPMIVHVHADWCPTCARQAPILEKLSQEPAYKSTHLVRVDFDNDEEFTARYHVTQQSTIILFRSGKESGRFGGVTAADKLSAQVAAGLS